MSMLLIVLSNVFTFLTIRTIKKKTTCVGVCQWLCVRCLDSLYILCYLA